MKVGIRRQRLIQVKRDLKTQITDLRILLIADGKFLGFNLFAIALHNDVVATNLPVDCFGDGFQSLYKES